MTASARSKRSFTVGSVVLATLLGFASTSPVLDSIVYDATPHTCAPHQCSQDAQIIEAYDVGKIYEYDYVVDSIAEMRSASPSKESKLNMAARVKVQVLTPCEFSVKVTNVVMNGKTEVGTMNQELSRYPSEFVLENRQVQRVCSHPQEPEWVTNIKKGVISSFQSTILPEGTSIGFNVTETDVVGICETEYLPTRVNGDYHTYQKTKHMDTCLNNQELFQFALNLPDMNIQNLPLMRSEHSCQVTVFGDGRLESSDCSETHVFQPFSSASSGAVATVRRQVTLAGQTIPASTQRMAETRESSLIFVHPEQRDQASNDQAKLVLELLNSFKSSDEAARPEMFSQLVHSMRRLSHSQLLNIFYNGITDPEMRILALDAIPLLKTDAGIALMKDIVESGELPHQTLDMWFATLPYYKNPTRGMLGIVSNFLRGEPLNSALLGVSSLVSSYCKENTECQDLPEVQAIITQYEQLLGSQCAAIDSAEEDKVILALKALRTIGHLRRGHAVVERCYTDSTNSMFVRLAAVDTIKQLNCGQDDYDFKRQLFATFSDATADSELRIGAYLALMNCPSQSMVNLVKSVLVNEPVNQVGSFVWTHLTNLQESQSLSEHKKTLKTLVGRDFLQNKWRTDVRKFSRYFESSYYAKDLNVGATTDGHIVFSQDSYLPRSGMLNLTANVFGENLHLLEIGSRVEGFEGIFEDLFGPDGYFREDSLHKLLQSLRQKRSNQDVSGTISGFQQTYNQDIDDASPRGNMYMRMFGRDLHYASFDGLDSLLTKVSPVSLFSSSSPDLDFSRSSIFLDGKIVVPTLAGFPLDLDVNGTSAVSLKSQNKFELSNLFRSGDASLEVKLYPTATLQISATMTIDAKHNQAGLKSLSKLHTSTYLDGEARMESGKLMKARLNVPKQTVDVLDVSVDFFSMNDEGTFEPLTSENDAVNYAGCTPNSFNRAVGMKLCGSALYHHNPQDHLAFAGPIKMKIGLEKIDTFDKYTFEYQRIPANPSESLTKMFAIWDTPGSSINRLSKINLALDESTLNFVKVDVEIPINQIKINALYRWTDADKVIKASFAMENEVLLSLRQSIQRTEEGKYNAIARATYKKFDIINLTGTFIATDRKIDVKTSLKSGYLAREIVAEGSLVNTNEQWDIDGKIKSNWINVDVKGLFIQTDTSFDFKSDLRYSGQGYNQAIKVQSAYKVDTAGQLDKHTFSVQFDPSNMPEWNTALRWELVTANNYLENAIKIKFGRHTYELEQLFSSQALADSQELLFALGFKAPDRDIAHRIAFEHRNGAWEKANRITLMLPGLIEFETYFEYLVETNLGSRKLKAGLTYYENEVAMESDLTLRPDLSGMDGQALVRWGQVNDPNTNIKADFKINQRTQDAIDFGLVANLVIPNFSPMKTEGSIKVEPGVSVVVEIKGNHGQTQFVTAVEAKKIATGGKLTANFKTTGIDYALNVMMRNDAVKSLHAVLNLGQKYELNAVARRNFRDLLFDLTYGTQPTDRVVFNARIAPTKLVAGLKMLGNEAKLTLERTPNKVNAEGSFNQDKMTIGVEYQVLPGDYFANVELTTTLVSVRDVKLNLVHKFKQQPLLELHSLAKLVWNGKSHSLEVKAEKGTNQGLIVVETKSAYATLNDILMKVESIRVDKRQSTNILLKYQEDAIKLTTIIDTGKPKEGYVIIETPWEYVRHMNVGFFFNYGQEVQLDTYCTWNELPMATANVTGVLKRGEIDLTFHVTQSRLGEAKAGLAYKNNERGMSSHIELCYGENSMKLSTDYAPDLGQGKSGTINLLIDTTVLKADGRVHFIGNNAQKLHMESHLDVANTRHFELKLDTNVKSLVEHRVEAKVQVTPYEVVLTATNAGHTIYGVVNAFYNMKVTKSKEEVSNVELTVQNTVNSKHGKFIFGIFKEITSVEVKHETKGNIEYVSSVRVQSQEKVFLLQHDTKLTGDLHFVSTVELKTPYDYMRRASTLIDVVIKPTELKAQATATFNEETLAVKLDGSMRLDNYQLQELDVTAALDGFLGKMSCEAKFQKVVGKVLATGTVNLPNHKPFKVTFTLTNIAGGAAVVVDVDAQTPFHLEGSFSRPTPTHFKETLELTFRQELVFKATSELEFEALTDFKATGILDMPLHKEQPIEFSALLKKGEAEIVADLEVKKVMKMESITQWSDKKITTTNKLALLGDNYAVVVRGETSGALKHFDASFTKNSKVWKVETTVTNDGVRMSFEGIYKCPDYQHRIEAKLDLQAQGIKVVYQFAGQEVKLTGQYMCDSPRVCTINAQLDNSFFDALSVAKIDGKLDAADLTHVTVILEATANDDHYLKLNGDLKKTTGDVEISMHCPIVKITNFSAKAHYEISNREGQATLTVGSVKQVDFSWKVAENLITAHLITPFNSIGEVLVLAKRDITYNGPTKYHFEIDVNRERIATFEGQMERRAVAVKLTSKYPNWRHVEIAFNLNTLTDFHLAAVYNNVFEARLLGHLTRQAGKFAAKMMIPLHTYETSMEYDLTQNKEFKIILQINEWKNSLVGHIKSNEAMIAMEIKGEQVFVTELTFNGVERYVGTAELTTKAVFLTHPINVLTKFDVAGEQKTVNIRLSVSGHTASANLKFKMTHDTFDGVMKCKSDIVGYEAATIKARYNIATEPTAKIQIERNGKVNFIETKLKFDNVIPTIQITTSFPNFEKMTFTGNYNGGENGHTQLDLALSRNDENLFVFALSIKPSATWRDADIVLTILTPITNWKTLNMELGWKSERDPYGLKIKLLKGQDEISFNGKVSYREGEFSFKLVTPFEGYESVGLSGKLGTTSLGKHMGISFDNNSVKRDVNMMMNDMGSRLDFNFENQGREDFAFGLKYDITRAPERGDFLIKIITNPHNAIDHEVKLEWNIGSEREFDALFYLNSYGDQLAYAKLERKVEGTTGHTTLDVRTPISGYENLKMELKGDYSAKAFFASVELGRIGDFSVEIDTVNAGGLDARYNVLAKTPFRGYEKLKAEIQVKELGSILDIRVLRDDVWIGTVTGTIQLTPALINIKFSAPSNLWAEVQLAYYDELADRVHLYWKSPRNNGDISFEYKNDGTTTSTTFNADVDGKFLKYFAERVSVEGKLTGKTKFETNLQWFEEETVETNYEIKYPPSYDLHSGPWEIYYQKKANGAETVLIKLTLTPSPNKWKLSALIKAPVEFFADGVECEVETEVKSDGLTMKLRYQTIEAQAEIKYSAEGGSFLFTSNIPTFEKILAQTKWILDNKKFRGELELARNDNVLLDTKVAVDLNPFSHFKFAVHFTDSEFQELEVRWNNFARGEGLFSFETKGFVELKITGRLAADPNTEDVLKLDVDVKNFNGLIENFRFGIKFGLKLLPLHKNFGFNVELTALDDVFMVSIETSDLDLSNGKAKIHFKCDLGRNHQNLLRGPLLAVLNVDVPARTFSVEVNEGNDKIFELTGLLDWTPLNVNVLLRAVLPGPNKKIELVAKRQNFAHIEYSFASGDGPSDKITFVSDNDISNPTAFDIKATLTIGARMAGRIGVGYRDQKIEFGIKSKRVGQETQVDGTLALNRRSYELKFKLKPTLEFNLSLKPSSGDNLFVVDFKNKDDGRLLNLQVTGKSLQIFENLSKKGGDFSTPINIKITENLQHTQLTFSLNLQQKSLRFRAGQGQSFVEITGKGKSAGNNKYFIQLEGATNTQPELFNIKAIAVYPLDWNLEVTYRQTTKVIVKAKATPDLSVINSSFEIRRNSASDNFRWRMEMINNADEKSVEMELDGAKQAEFVVNWKRSGEIKFQLDRFVNAHLLYSDNTAKLVLKVFERHEAEVEFALQNGGFKFEASSDIGSGFDVKALLDGNQRILDVKLTYARQDLTLKAQYTDTSLAIQVTEPWTDAGSHKLDVQFEKSGDGFNGGINVEIYNVKGKIEFKYDGRSFKLETESNKPWLEEAKLTFDNFDGEFKFEIEYKGLKSFKFAFDVIPTRRELNFEIELYPEYNLKFELKGDKLELRCKIDQKTYELEATLSGSSLNIEMKESVGSYVKNEIVLNGRFEKNSAGGFELNGSGKANNVEIKMTGKWEQGRLTFNIDSDVAWLKNVELFINIPGIAGNNEDFKVDLKSTIVGKEFKLYCEAEAKSLRVEITEPFTKSKIELNYKFEERRSDPGFKVEISGKFNNYVGGMEYSLIPDTGRHIVKVEGGKNKIHNSITFDLILKPERPDIIKLRIDARDHSDNYRLTGNVGLSGLTVTINWNDRREWKAEINVAKAGVGRSLTMLITGYQIETYKVSAKYSLDDKFVSARVNAEIPPYINNMDANFGLFFDIPKKMSFWTKVSHDGDVLVSVDAEVGVAQDFSDIRCTAKFTSASLSVPREVGVKVVYRLVAPDDFDLQAEVLTPAHTFKAGATLKVGPSKFDCQLKFANGRKEYNLKFGGSAIISSGEFDAYLNNFRIEFNFAKPTYYTHMKIALKVSGERVNLDGERDPIFEYISFDSFNIDLKVEAPTSVSLDAQVVNGDRTIHFRAALNYDEEREVKGGYFLNYQGYPQPGSSAEIVIQLGQEGSIEIVVGGLEKHQMTLQWPTEHNRVTRAIFDSPTYGHYEFLTGQDVNSAIVVLSTGHGIHKFAYQVHDEDKFELTVTLESSLISNGHPLTFHLLLDPVSETYSAKLTLDEDSFLSVSLGLNIEDIQATFTLQWPSNKIGGQVRLRNTAQLLSCELSLTVNDFKHMMKFVYRKIETSFVFVVRSPLIRQNDLGNEWSVEGSATVTEGSHEITAVANIANEKIQLQGKLDHHSWKNFGGKFVYQGTSPILAKANVDFKVLLDLERESIVKFEVTSTHRALPRVKVLLSMNGNTNGYYGNFVGILPKVDQIEASFRVDDKNWLTNGVNITASTLKHRISADLIWDWTQGIVEGVVLGPKAADKWMIKTKLTTEILTMTIETTRRGLDKIDLLVKWDPESSCEGGNGKFVMKFLGKEMDGEIMYNMRPDAKYILASLNTPFQHHEAYELQFGYEDSADQKQAKAHLTTPSGQLGFLVDFYINALEDFLFLIEIDLPIPELKLTKIKLGHSIKEDLHSLALGAETNDLVFTIDYRLKSDVEGTTLLDIEARYNENNFILKTYANVEEMKFDVVMKAITQWGKLEIPLSFESTRNVKLNVIVNDVTHVVLKKSKATGTVTLELRDIYVPSAFKLAVINDEAEGAASCTLEMVWDTTNAAETTEVMSVSWRKTETSFEFGSQITWRYSRDTDAITGKIDRTHGQLQVTLSVLHNNRRDWGLDMSSQFEYQGQVDDTFDNTKKLAIVVPSHAIEYDLHQRERSDISHCDASLKWAQRDGPKYGLEYVYDVQKLNDDGWSSTLLIRQIGRQVQTFSSRYQTGRGIQSVSVDINHSHDLTRSINLEASLDSSNSNAQRTTVKVRSSYTFGAMPTQRNDLTVSLDEEQFLMEFADSNNIYTLHGKKAQEGVKQVALAVNGQQFSRLFVRIDKDKPLMNADLKFAEHIIRLAGGLMESNVIGFNVETQRKGENAVVELDTSLVLSSDGRVLEAKFDWRPEILQDTRQALTVLQDNVLTATQRALPHVSEYAAHLEKIVKLTIDETARQIKETLDVDISQYLYVYETLRDNIESLYINSLPVVKVVMSHATKMLTICVREINALIQKTMTVGKTFIDIAQDVANDAVRFVFVHFQGTWEFIMEIRSAIIDELAQLEVGDFNAGDYVKVTVQFVRVTLEKVTEVYKKWSEYLALLPAEVSGELEADVARFLNDLSEFLKKFKTVNNVLALYWDYQSWFEEFHLSQRFEEATSDFRSQLVDIGRQLSQIKASLVAYWNTTVGKINGTLSDYPLLAYGVSVGKTVLKVAKKLVDQLSIEQNMKVWVRKIFGRADAVASTLVRLIDVIYHEKDLIGYDFNYDLTAGSIVYRQVMPFQWYSFQDTPDIIKVADLVGLKSSSAADGIESLDLKALQHDILEFIDVISTALHAKSVIPPFSATALVAGDSHIITFDQTYYNFAGSEGCSYLLTSDFSHGRFSAIANYDSDMRRTSIDIVSDGHTINIDTNPSVDGLIKVTLDKRNSQLPIQFDHTYVYREENTIVVENSEGLRTSCNTVYNVCTFTISGWYFGKTGGLLGIYDNEPSNDWMTSDREIVHSLEDFVNSWSVTHDRQCPVRFFSNSPAQPTLEEAHACESAFSSTDESSALMPCFSTVDPEPYKAMCLRDMQTIRNRADKQSGVCSSAAAYIKQCEQAGVELWMPGHCVRCDINSQETMANGESTRIQGNAPQSADVVFIVQQSSCLRDLELQDLPLLVDRSLTNKGLTDNRYALVSFAGSNHLQRPHIFTSGSQIFNDVARMKTALDHLSNMQSDGTVGDIFEALQFSARLNLRAGVVKTFVLVRCDTSESLTSRAYGDSMTMLLEQGISLHVMMPLEMRLKGSTTKLTSKMYGFSKDTVVTASTLDHDLRRQLQDPKDQVSTLAQESGGVVFDLNKLKSRKRTMAKKASTMMGKAVAELSQPLDCELCDCLADADGKGRVMCHRCVLPSIDIVLQNLEMMLNQ